MISPGKLYTACATGIWFALSMCCAPCSADAKWKEKTLYSFAGGSDGSTPSSSLIEDKKGDLYGTTSSGGVGGGCSSFGCGVVFKLTPKSLESVLYSFCSQPRCADGQNPTGAVIAAKHGYFYGATPGGGAYGYGAVFMLSRDGAETTPYSFQGAADGGNPNAPLIADKQGNLFGTAAYGGANRDGVVFQITPQGAETVLHSFAGGEDGAVPLAALASDRSGNLFGTTADGGPDNEGTIFEITAAGAETILYAFTNGGDPQASLILNKQGNLFGTTLFGGKFGDGTVFKCTPDGVETDLYTFSGGNDGGAPQSSLIADNNGNLYGTTSGGGAHGRGTVFRLSPDGKETALYAFTGGSDGEYPSAGLIADQNGNLFGTTSAGGTADVGVVFELSN
jgi:uncharacterized repeat protein (TIGR03803 family)